MFAELSWRKCLLKYLAAQRFKSIHMTRASLNVIPRAITALLQSAASALRRPQFDERVDAQVEVPSGKVREQIAQLLLARSFDLFDIVEILFDGRSIGYTFGEHLNTQLRISRKEGGPVSRRIVTNDNDSNLAAPRPISRDGCFVSNGARLAIKVKLACRPTLPVARSLGQVQFVFAINAVSLT